MKHQKCTLHWYLRAQLPHLTQPALRLADLVTRLVGVAVGVPTAVDFAARCFFTPFAAPAACGGAAAAAADCSCLYDAATPISS